MHGCISGLILHGAFQTKFLGILYQKLSTFMVIRRGAGSFKCHFQIFVYFLFWPGHHYGIMARGFTSISLLSIGVGAHFFMRDRSYQWLKDATLFGLISDKSAEIWGSEYSNIGQFSILAMADIAFLFVFACMQISWVMSLPIAKLQLAWKL